MAYPTTLERERELLALAQAGDAGACAELVRLHTPFVRSVVRRFPVFLREDLVAEGVVGLLEAVHRFDVAHDVRFVTYAAHWIRSRMQAYSRSVHRAVSVPRTRIFRLVAARGRHTEDALTRQLGRTPRADELAAALGIHEAELLEARAFFSQGDAQVDSLARVLGANAPRADELLEQHETRGELTAALERCLSERDRAIVLRYVGGEEATLREVGETYGLSYERVRQIVRVGLERLRHDLERAARDEDRRADRPVPPPTVAPARSAAPAPLPPVAGAPDRGHRRRPSARRRCEAPRTEPADGSAPATAC